MMDDNGTMAQRINVGWGIGMGIGLNGIGMEWN